MAERFPAQNHAENNTDKKIYNRYKDTDFYVAGHEFGRTVHRTVKVRFALYFKLFDARFIFGYGTLIVFGFDRGLFHRHGVQRKPGGNFGDARRTLGDNEGLNRNQYDEYNQADDESLRASRTDDKGSERRYKPAVELRALGQYEPRRRNVQRKAVHGRNKQHHGK